jgi:hypothetical protein
MTDGHAKDRAPVLVVLALPQTFLDVGGQREAESRYLPQVPENHRMDSMTDLEELDDLQDFADFCGFADHVDYERLRGARGVLGALLDQGFNRMGHAVFNVLERQRKAVVDKVRGLFLGRQGTATELIPGVGAVLDTLDFEVEVKAAAYGVMEQLVVNGSHVELDSAVGARIKRLARLDHDVNALRMKLPIKVRRGIDEALAESMAMPYWSDLADKTGEQLRQQLAEAAMAGERLDQVVARIRLVMGPEVSRIQAERIARTETTRGLNAGLQLSRNHLAALGLVVAKRWQAVDPQRVTRHPTRKTHAVAHNQEVAPDGMFIVGGFPCRYPGDPRLPARESIQCRCLAVSVRA